MLAPVEPSARKKLAQVPVDSISEKIPHSGTMRSAILCLLVFLLQPQASPAQAPDFTVVSAESSIRFSVKSSVALHGRFDKWKATLIFPSADVTTGVLHIQIDAATVDTGSGMKNKKLKGKDFFDVERYPSIAFQSTKVVQTSPVTFDVDGNFSIRGVTRLEKLKLTIPEKPTGADEIQGELVFNRKHYGMNKGIPFVKIEDHVQVTINLKVRQVSGPKLMYPQ
jgi:polyisoprenoid-binding protein YceI